MAGIFISYRRQDAAGHAGRLFDRLRERFGAGRVFMDVAGIEPGSDFVHALDRAIGGCDVALVVIGRDWLTCTDEHSRRQEDASGKPRRRLDDPNDFVHLEIVTALRRDVRVIPVLVEDAEPPPAEQLPIDMQALARRHAIELTDGRWNSDVESLIESLEKMITPAPPEAIADAAGDSKRRKWGYLAAIGGMAALVAAAWSFWMFYTVAVPDLKGLADQQAIHRLREAGLEQGFRTLRKTAGVLPGTVIDQSPAGGTRTRRGQQIALWLADAPEPEKRGVARFSRDTLDFGAEHVGRRSDREFSMANSGNAPLTIREFRFVGEAGDFSVDSETCINATLSSGEQCAVSVHFSPRAAGRQQAALTVVDTQSQSYGSVTLNGEGVPADRESSGGAENPNLAGPWRDQNGTPIVIRQEGDRITMTLRLDDVEIRVSGRLQGTEVRLHPARRDAQLSHVQLQLSPDGRQLQGMMVLPSPPSTRSIRPPPLSRPPSRALVLTRTAAARTANQK